MASKTTSNLRTEPRAPGKWTLDNLVVGWRRMAASMALAAVEGVASGLSWSRQCAAPWWAGWGSLLPTSPASEEAPDDRAVEVPLLGALLVSRYRAITPQQLAQALEQQLGDHPRQRRLGEILLETGRLTQSQLQEALDYQRLRLRRREGIFGRPIAGGV